MADQENILGEKIGTRGAGRPKGVPNKTTKAVKDALTEAFDNMGGVAYLSAWAQENPTEFYKLWAKMLPSEVKAAVTVEGELPVGRVVVEVISAHPTNSSN